MRGRHRTGAGAAEVSLTPMLDVVFILLIFFMVTSTFTQEQAITVFYLSVLVIPALILLLGLAVWWRRSAL